MAEIFSAGLFLGGLLGLILGLTLFRLLDAVRNWKAGGL